MIDFKKIRVAIFDVDGTLTDGSYFISSEEGVITRNPVVTKRFYTRDWYALEQLLKSGLNVVILTEATDGCILKRLDYIKNNTSSKVWKDAFEDRSIFCMTGIKNKVNAMEEYLAAWDLGKGWNFDQIAYIGDAENDLECMQKALYTGCPSDAVSIIKGESNYLCDAKGGYGAVYEFCMHILEKIKEQKNENNET